GIEVEIGLVALVTEIVDVAGRSLHSGCRRPQSQKRQGQNGPCESRENYSSQHRLLVIRPALSTLRENRRTALARVDSCPSNPPSSAFANSCRFPRSRAWILQTPIGRSSTGSSKRSLGS